MDAEVAMRRVLTAALGIGLGWGCATEESARRDESKESKGTQYVIVTTRTRPEPPAQAEQQRAQADQQRAQADQERAQAERMRESQMRLREAADREAQARVKAELEAERAQRIKAERASEADRAELAQLRAQQAQRELEQAREAQSQLKKELEEERQRAKAQAQALAEEQRARSEAQQNVRGALEEVASVRQEARGLVVTLAAPLLFTVNDSTLLPAAQERLDAIADALRASGNESFRIEGHTDSRGREAYNLELSRRRAEAVRAYLLSRGVDADQIRAFGYGEHRPVTTNATAEGRAINRRVEIILPKFGVGGSGGRNLGGERAVPAPGSSETDAPAQPSS
jgi:outer membrane protein OmpA-like peptidoglycan-associated protein